MKKPKWIEKYKEPKTEIKFVNGHFYKYRVEYRYNKIKKRTDKITKEILGKVTKEGFIPSKSVSIDLQENIDIKQYGAFRMFYELLKSDLDSLESLFDNQTSKILLIVAYMRWAHQAPIKRMPTLYSQSYISEHWKLSGFHAKKISSTLKKVGAARTQVVEWMKSCSSATSIKESEYVMIDGTHIPTKSERLNINHRGYNGANSYSPQVSLIYIYSTELRQPVYYRMVNGNIVDLKAMKYSIEEIGLKKVCFVADKGFYSKDNIELLQEYELQYIIPIRRNNKMVRYDFFQDPVFKEKAQYFTYLGRVIWYFEYVYDHKSIIIYLDEQLRVKEERDYLSRIETHPEKFSYEKFCAKVGQFGTMTIVHKLDTPVEASSIYKTYKQRNEIEVMFSAYKGFLEADKTYMQDRLVMEGWLMANFIAMKAYYELLQRLKKNELNTKYSPMDLLEYSKGIAALKINGNWNISETTKKIQKLFSLVGIDYLNLRS